MLKNEETKDYDQPMGTEYSEELTYKHLLLDDIQCFKLLGWGGQASAWLVERDGR
jgi:hypothetical protein